MGQHGNKLLGHVTAAKDIDPAGGVDLFGENITGTLGMPGKYQVRRNFQAPDPFFRRMQSHFSISADIGQKPQVMALAEYFLRHCAKRQGMGITGGQIVEKHVAGTAADHS